MVEPPGAPVPTSSTAPAPRAGELVRPRLRPIPAWVIVVCLPFMVLVAVAAVWLVLGAELDRTKLDAIRTGSTLGVGLGGLLVLWLATRRQRSTELDLLAKYEAHELAERTATETLAHQRQVAADVREDALARRITDLYTKAVEQLGSDKAPVRLGGLYALERLAQDNPDDPHLRQTVVNVWCAYLRMPYTPPADTPPENADEKTVTLDQEQRQEREVRLAAQRVLAAHLRPELALDRLADTFWSGVDVDLTGATLIDLDLGGCHLAHATFTYATFTGSTSFSDGEFGPTWFAGAKFGSEVLFHKTKFAGHVWFNRAEFAGNALFDDAKFAGNALFDDAKFAGNARFNDAKFAGNALLNRAEFAGDAWFNEAKFAGAAWFNEAKFAENAWFNDAEFAENAWFNDAKFAKNARFNDAKFAKNARFNDAKFAGFAWFDDAEFAGNARFDGATFQRPVQMVATYARVDQVGITVWPPGWKSTGVPGAREHRDGLWADLVRDNANDAG